MKHVDARETPKTTLVGTVKREGRAEWARDGDLGGIIGRSSEGKEFGDHE